MRGKQKGYSAKSKLGNTCIARKRKCDQYDSGVGSSVGVGTSVGVIVGVGVRVGASVGVDMLGNDDARLLASEPMMGNAMQRMMMIAMTASISRRWGESDFIGKGS